MPDTPGWVTIGLTASDPGDAARDNLETLGRQLRDTLLSQGASPVDRIEIPSGSNASAHYSVGSVNSDTAREQLIGYLRGWYQADPRWHAITLMVGSTVIGGETTSAPAAAPAESPYVATPYDATPADEPEAPEVHEVPEVHEAPAAPDATPSEDTVTLSPSESTVILRPSPTADTTPDTPQNDAETAAHPSPAEAPAVPVEVPVADSTPFWQQQPYEPRPYEVPVSEQPTASYGTPDAGLPPTGSLPLPPGPAAETSPRASGVFLLLSVLGAMLLVAAGPLTVLGFKLDYVTGVPSGVSFGQLAKGAGDEIVLAVVALIVLVLLLTRARLADAGLALARGASAWGLAKGVFWAWTLLKTAPDSAGIGYTLSVVAAIVLAVGAVLVLLSGWEGNPLRDGFPILAGLFTIAALGEGYLFGHRLADLGGLPAYTYVLSLGLAGGLLLLATRDRDPNRVFVWLGWAAAGLIQVLVFGAYWQGALETSFLLVSAIIPVLVGVVAVVHMVAPRSAAPAGAVPGPYPYPQPVSPQGQPVYPQPPAYPQQPAYSQYAQPPAYPQPAYPQQPAQPAYPQQPYPQPSAYPAPQQQPAYPQQQPYPQYSQPPGYPQQPAQQPVWPPQPAQPAYPAPAYPQNPAPPYPQQPQQAYPQYSPPPAYQQPPASPQPYPVDAYLPPASLYPAAPSNTPEEPAAADDPADPADVLASSEDDRETHSDPGSEPR